MPSADLDTTQTPWCREWKDTVLTIKRVACLLAAAAGVAWLVAAIWLAVTLAKHEQSPVPDFTAMLAGTMTVAGAVVWSTAWIVERQHAAVRIIRPAWAVPVQRGAVYVTSPPGGGPTLEQRPLVDDKDPYWRAYEAVTDTAFGPRDDDPETDPPAA